MKNSKQLFARLMVTVSCLAGLSQPACAAVAGYVQFVSGEVQIANASGNAYKAKKGDAINEGDMLTSAQNSSAQIRMQDGGFVAVRPDTRMKFDQFVFAGKEDGSEKGFFSLFKGGFRAVTGLIGRINKQNYRITTPAATIGIRGTDHETFVIVPDSPLAQVAPTGAYSKVNTGETSLTTDKGTIFVQPNQMGFAGGMNQVPQVQPVNTRVFTVAAAPAPGAKVEKKEEKKESGENGQGKQAAKSEKPGNGQSADSAATPVRESAVVDATPPAAGSIPASTAPANAPVVVPIVSVVPPPSPPPVLPPTLSGPTAAFVNTDISWDVANVIMGSGFGSNGPPGNIVGSPNPTSFTSNSNCTQCNITSTVITVSGGTPSSFSDAATGIKWGYWTAPTSVTKTTTGAGGATTPYTTPGVVGWITAPSSSFMLPMVLTGTASYSLINGVASDGAFIGTVNSATLSVNFTQQLVGLALNVTANGVGWTATGTGASLGYSRGNSGFAFNTTPNAGCTGCAQGTLTLTSAAAPVSGYISGELTGNGLTGAILSYSLYGSTSKIAGVAALGLSATTPINTAQSWQGALSSMPALPQTLNAALTNYPNNGVSTPYPIVQDSANGSAFSAAALVVDAAGNPTFIPNGNTNVVNATGTLTGPASVTFSGATAIGGGTDAVSGIKWGRWSGGSIVFTPLAGGAPVTIANVPGGVHWVLPPASSGANSLPVSGTYNYVLAGGTLPTDQAGTVGVVNSASLTANFSAMTVDIAANVTVAGTTFAGSAIGTPIQNGIVFGANKGALGTVTCTGACGAVHSGNAVGVFTQAGLGAAVTYGFQTGPTVGSPTVVVGGVAAFHR